MNPKTRKRIAYCVYWPIRILVLTAHTLCWAAIAYLLLDMTWEGVLWCWKNTSSEARWVATALVGWATGAIAYEWAKQQISDKSAEK